MKYKIPSWSALRALGDSKVIKLTCLTPFLGYVIVLSDYFMTLLTQVNSYLSLSKPEEAAISNAYFMYFGLLSLGVASGIYALFAPNLTKEYQSIRCYLNENIDYVTLSKLVGLACHVKKEFTQKDKEEHTIFGRINSFEQVTNENSSSFTKELRTLSVDLFSHFWNQTAYSKKIIRVLITMFYAIGFILLLVPTMKLLWNVIF
jgi:hypothetical protein